MEGDMDDLFRAHLLADKPEFRVEKAKADLVIINKKLKYIQNWLIANILNQQPENDQYYYRIDLTVEKRQMIWKSQRDLLLKREALEQRIKELRGLKHAY